MFITADVNSGLLENITTTTKVEDVSQYSGSYLRISETGDSCDELVIKVVDEKVIARYRSWYCAEGGEPPEFEDLKNASIVNGIFKGTLANGYQVSWKLKK